MYLYIIKNRGKIIERLEIAKEDYFFYFIGNIKVSKKTMKCYTSPYKRCRYFLETPELLIEYEKKRKILIKRIEKAVKDLKRIYENT